MNNTVTVNEIVCEICDSKLRIYFGKKEDGTSILYTLPKLLLNDEERAKLEK